MKLRTPLVPSASPLSEDVDNIKCMEDAGASAIVFHSLFEEQIRADGYEPRRGAPRPANRIPRRSPFFRSGKFPRHARGLRQAHCASKTVNKNPDHRSLNGSTFGGWTTFAREIEQAGADALELNLYSLPTDPGISAEEIETSYLTILTSVIGQVRIPVAVKLSPFFTNLSQFAQRLVQSGAARVGALQSLLPAGHRAGNSRGGPAGRAEHALGDAPAAALDRHSARAHWRELAASGCIHRATDALKMLMAGAT
jgi:dihydroorotate dehydrogenase (fumarate)